MRGTEVEQAVHRALRAYMTRCVLLNHRVAEQTGLHLTDLQCLGLLQLHGPLTPGELARHTGLTAGAITTAVGRLEQRGLAARSHDTDDRRRVLVTVCQQELDRSVTPAYEDKGPMLRRVFDEFGADELGTVLRFLEILERAENATR